MKRLKKQRRLKQFLMNWLENLIQGITNSISATIRKFSAYSMILFFLGAIYGFYIDKISLLLNVERHVLLFIPAILAVLAYLFTEIAVLIFVVLILLTLIVFI